MSCANVNTFPIPVCPLLNNVLASQGYTEMGIPFVYTPLVYWKMEAYQIVTPQLSPAYIKLPGTNRGKQLKPIFWCFIYK